MSILEYRSCNPGCHHHYARTQLTGTKIRRLEVARRHLCCNVQGTEYQFWAHSEVPFIDFHSPLLLVAWPRAFTHRSVNRSTALPTALYCRCRQLSGSETRQQCCHLKSNKQRNKVSQILVASDLPLTCPSHILWLRRRRRQESFLRSW
jgi:hypothetical protein